MLSLSLTGVAGLIIENGFTHGDIHVIFSSTAGIRCKTKVKATEYIIKEGSTINISVKGSCETKAFMAVANQHNRRAKYKYEGSENPVFFLEGSERKGWDHQICFEREGTYRIWGKVTYRWKTNRGKIAAGFPAYYYKTVYSSVAVIKVYDKDPSSETEGNDQDKEEEKLSFKGEVEHTKLWNEHREKYNNYYEQRDSTMLRGENVFWPGEKFCLKGISISGKQPETVYARIEGTDYGTSLTLKDGRWVGYIFNDDMRSKWSRYLEKEVVFAFTAKVGGKVYVDKVIIIIDNREEYWLMHRKE